MKTIVLAVALTVPAGLSVAASMSELVTTRESQDIYQQFGRDSVYAVQTRQPADTGSRYSSNESGIGGVFAGIGSAGAAAWDRVTGLFDSDTSTRSVTPPEPERYGRAGGYVGTDQLALLARAGTAPPTNEVVTTGESLAATESSDLRYPPASESQLYESERQFNSSDNRFERSDERVQGATSAAGSEPAPAMEPSPVIIESSPAVEAEMTPSPDVEQRAASPEAGSVEEQAEFPGTTAAPADDDDWQRGDMRQPEESDVTSDGDITRDGRG
jgi:hypothetical protein